MKFVFITLLSGILMLSIVTACQTSASSSPTVSKTTETPAQASPQTADKQIPDDAAARITLAEAKKDFDAGIAVFVDTRGEDAYKYEHIKGAINVPANMLAARMKDIPTGKKIIAYCS